MVEWLVFVSPVLSALLGAVAIKGVEVISNRRSGISSIHSEIVENYWLLEGEIQHIQEGRWSKEYTREVRLDAIEAVKARSPGVYIQLVEEIDGFPVAINSLTNIKREQIETKKADVELADDEGKVIERLREIQDILLTVEENIAEYSTGKIRQKILLANTIKRPDLEAAKNSSADCGSGKDGRKSTQTTDNRTATK